MNVVAVGAPLSMYLYKDSVPSMLAEGGILRKVYSVCGLRKEKACQTRRRTCANGSMVPENALASLRTAS